MADQFGITKRDATQCRGGTGTAGSGTAGVPYPDYQWTDGTQYTVLELDTDVLEQITFPEECVTKQEPEAKKEENRKNFGVESGAGWFYRGYHSNRGHLPPETERGITEKGHLPTGGERRSH